MKGLLFVLALAGVAAAGKKSVTTYTAEAKQKELTQLRDTQKKAESEAKADCSSYPLANPILDCEKESACYRADVKWGAMEKSFLSSAKAQWKQILATVEASTKSNETLAHYSADLRHVQDHLAKLVKEKAVAQQGQAKVAAANQKRVKYANDALKVVSRLKNYVELADKVDSAHDFVVPLYNVQGGDPSVNGMLGGVIKVILGNVQPQQRKATYTNELVRVEADLIALMKSIYEEEPKSRMQFETVTMPSFSKEISQAQLEEKEMRQKVEAVKNLIHHKMKNLPVDKTYHAVLLKRYEQARADRVLNRDQCKARMKKYAKGSQLRNEQIKVLQALKAPTAAALKAKAARELELESAAKKNAAAPFSCPRTADCTGTIESPCRLPWSDIRGKMFCVWSVTTNRRQKDIYQQPGWEPVYPSCIAEDSVGCVLRPAAQLESIKNPSTSKIAQYKSTLLSLFKKGTFSVENMGKTQQKCATLTDAELNAKGDACYTVGCGLEAGKPCLKNWETANGNTACLLSRPADSRDASTKQNPGWLPVCPATVLGEMHACSPQGLEDKQCNPSVELRDVVGKKAVPGACTKVDCELSDWGQWSACSRTCAKGHRFRQRGIIQAASCGGSKCGDLLQKEECDSGRMCPLAEGQKCSHVNCNLATHKDGSKFVKVSHHKKELNGISHHCAWNPFDAKCHCACTHGKPYKPLKKF